MVAAEKEDVRRKGGGRKERKESAIFSAGVLVTNLRGCSDREGGCPNLGGWRERCAGPRDGREDDAAGTADEPAAMRDSNSSFQNREKYFTNVTRRQPRQALQ